MSSAIDDDDLDLDDEPQHPPANVGRRRSSAGTSGITSEVDKAEDEAMARKGAMQRRQKLWSTVICGSLLIAFICLLTFFTAETLLSPEVDLPFTKVSPKSVTTPPGFNTSGGVSTSNGSDAELEAFGDMMSVSDTELQSGPFQLNLTDANLFCETEDCKNLASFLKDLLSTRRDACGSLYDHVCSRWARIHRRLAEARGRYSIDEAVLDAYRQQVSRRLLDPSIPLTHQRSFYVDCVHGRLLTEEDMQDITNDMMLPDKTWAPESLAKAVARMSRIGVSPFFDISVKPSNDLFKVNLRLLDAIREHRSNINDFGKNSGNSGDKNISRDNIENVSNRMAFFSALEQFLCQEIREMSGLNWSCVVTVDRAVQAPWRYEWYTSTGPTLLAQSIASILEDLSVSSKALEENIQMRTSFRAIPSSEQERSTRCLRFIDTYDPTLIPHLITTYLAPRIQYAAKKTFARLKATLEKNIPNVSTIGTAFMAPRILNHNTFLLNQSHDLYGGHTTFNGSKLRKFLVSSTWKRWTGAFIFDTPSLSTTPTLCRNHYALSVPLGLFNLTRAPDKWLEVLSLARVGPRILRAAFSLPYLSHELQKTRFARCISGLQKLLHRVGGSHVPGGEKGPDRTAGKQIAPRDIGLNLDIVEIASFYLSLQTYRDLIGEALTVLGTALNSDSLFLLYYAFDNCQVEVGSEATEMARRRPRYARALRYRGTPDDTTDRRRRRVDSVAAMFGGVLLEKCQRIANISACEKDSQEHL